MDAGRTGDGAGRAVAADVERGDSDSDDERSTAAAAAAALAKHARLQGLAAARTLEAAVAMVNSRRARQRNNMRPLLLDEGALVRVSFLYAPTVRRTLKQLHGAEYLPKWSVELYTVVKRYLAPGSRRVVLYHLKVDRSRGNSGVGFPCTVGTHKVRLRFDLEDVDRRWLQPVARDADAGAEAGDPLGEHAAVTRTIAKRYPGQTLALSTTST